MSYAMDSYYGTVASAPATERAAFIRRTYAHLAGAVLAFAAIEFVLLSLPNIDQIILSIFGHGNLGMLLLMVGFVGASYLANSWANSSTSVPMQYAGLGLYVVVQAVIFLPLLYIANTRFEGQNIILQAGIMTLAVFAGLTVAVITTGKDFSFLGPVLSIASLLAIGFIVAAMIFGFNLGLVFMFAMVGLASMYIIYDTSNVIHRYNTSQHVAAALALFASVALLFFYILKIAMASQNRN